MNLPTDIEPIRAARRIDFIRLVKVALQKDFVWDEFVGDWNENDWPELSEVVRSQISSWVRQYKARLQTVRASGDSKESMVMPKWYFSQILRVLVDGKPLPTEDDIPF
jgi:hypothetical protein